MCLQKAVGIGYCSCYRRRTEVALATMGRKRGCRGGKKVAKKPAYVLALLCCLVGCAVGLMSVSCAVCCVLCVPVRHQHAALDFDRGAVRLAALGACVCVCMCMCGWVRRVVVQRFLRLFV